MKWYDRRTRIQKMAFMWWEFHVSSPLNLSPIAAWTRSLLGICPQCGLKRPSHKMDCSAWRRGGSL